MSLATRLSALATAVGNEIRDFRSEVKAGYSGKVDLPQVSATATYVRVAVVNGLTATQGGNISMIIGGTGGIGSLPPRRQTLIVNLTQRGDNNVDFQGWKFGGPSTSWTLYTKQISTYSFELWALRPAYDSACSITALSPRTANVDIKGDMATTTAPTGLTPPTIDPAHVVVDTDIRLYDQRAPTSHSHLLSDIPDTMEKYPVLVATTANITLSGTQTIDGVAVVAGDRVLVKSQTSTPANGIYVVNAGAWARATDADSTLKLRIGTQVYVETGTMYGGMTWRLASRITTLGSSVQTWNSRALESFAIGAIYQTSVVGSPANLFGGQWTPINDRMLIAMGSNSRWSSAVLNVGGSETVTLTAAQSGSPAHKHGTAGSVVVNTGGAGITGSTVAAGSSYGFGYYSPGSEPMSTATNATSSHDNMPPYLSVYMWRRTG